MVQEYGRYFGMQTCCLRGGCLTGPEPHRRRAARLPELPGQVQSRGPRCTASSATRGSRSATTSTRTTSPAFIERVLAEARGRGEVYNIGGGRENSCSHPRSVRAVAAITGKPMQTSNTSTRTATGDHICYISDLSKMKAHYPGWTITKSLARHLQRERPRLGSAEPSDEPSSSMRHPSLLLGAHIHPATGDAARRQVRAMTCLRETLPDDSGESAVRRSGAICRSSRDSTHWPSYGRTRIRSPVSVVCESPWSASCSHAWRRRPLNAERATSALPTRTFCSRGPRSNASNAGTARRTSSPGLISRAEWNATVTR